MNFLLILCAAVIEFTIVSVDGLRSVSWSRDWMGWLNRQFRDSPWWHGWPAAAVVLGVPLAVAAGCFGALFRMSHFLGYLASLFFLLLMLGPSDLNRVVDRYRRHLSATATDDDDGANEGSDSAFLTEAAGIDLGASTGDVHFDETRVELAALAIAADRAWYQPLFWFFLGGPLGALAYRLCANLGESANDERGIATAIAGAREAMEWLPARITVLAFGMAGSLTPVLEAARASGIMRWGASSELRARAALAAIDNGRIHEAISGEPRVYRLNLMHALVRRSLNVWLVLLAAGSLLL